MLGPKGNFSNIMKKLKGKDTSRWIKISGISSELQATSSTSNQRRMRPNGKKNTDIFFFLYNAQVASFQNILLSKKNVLVFFLSSSELQWHKVVIEIGPSREKNVQKKDQQIIIWFCSFANSTSPMPGWRSQACGYISLPLIGKKKMEKFKKKPLQF